MSILRSGSFLGVVLSAALISVSISGASAADVTATQPQNDTASVESGWQIYWPTYLWAAGTDGTARTLPPLPASDLDISFGESLDAMKDLDAGLITSVFAHNDRLRLMADVNWMRLSPDENLDVAGTPAKLKMDSETFTLMSAVGYRLVDEEHFSLDAYVGAKLWYMNNSAKLKPAVITPKKVDKEHTWVDGVVGAEIVSNITDHAYISLIGFAGTGGSNFFGDAYGGVGYRFNEKYDAFAGYRVMRVDHEDGLFSYEVTQHGPLLGIGVKF
jgi:hypothetical protein